MSTRKLKFLFIQPDWHRHYVPFFPVYEPLHGLLLGAVVKDLAETRVFDRRFDTEEAARGLAEALKGKPGRVGAFEVLPMNLATSALVRENKLAQLEEMRAALGA